ncbi:hypothetical protein ETB97_010080 [Aspergillus alliaceus]|uniref:Uncharacterized protein n=1 Tax=Petromyces alliaceus TaxID=209559 RepID=A0A8H6AB11_PETAA|nr:hypothetical protein ETB97_010080 [Aspergillus burnettii]
MVDFEAKKPLQESSGWYLFHLSECLEDRLIKHCIAGDAILTTLGHPLVICQLYLVVADEQLEDALAVMLQQGLEQSQGPAVYVDRDATVAPLGWPGYTLKRPRASFLAPEVSLVPSSFWHMDLSEASLLKNTFLHPTTRCRFPTRLFYIDGICYVLDASSIHSFLALKLLLSRSDTPHLALINAIIESTLKPGHNMRIYGYLEMQYLYLVNWLSAFSPDTLLKLPPGNRFFVDLYGTPLPPATRRRVCLNRQRIQLGLLTVEDAWGSMPIKFINTIKKIEAERMDKMRRSIPEVG